MRSRTLAFSMVLVGIAACGGNVIVETTTGGEGGVGGAGTGTSTSSGVGGDDVQSTCTKLCAIGDAFNCDAGGDVCVPSCVDGVAAVPQSCKDEYLHILDCVSLVIPQSGCELFDECESEILAFTACLGGAPPGCDDATCVGSETACSCKGVCAGQALAVECNAQGSELACTCYADGAPVGNCSEPATQSSGCDLESGCCSAFF